MTVGELIKELRKWPKDMKVVTAAHDNGDDEFQSQIYSLVELAPGEQRDWHGPCVVLRG